MCPDDALEASCAQLTLIKSDTGVQGPDQPKWDLSPLGPVTTKSNRPKDTTTPRLHRVMEASSPPLADAKKGGDPYSLSRYLKGTLLLRHAIVDETEIPRLTSCGYLSTFCCYSKPQLRSFSETMEVAFPFPVCEVVCKAAIPLYPV